MSIPDLRQANAATHAEFLGIVIGGSRSNKGMPRFETMTPEQGEAIRAFLINQAWAAYNAQQAVTR
jgi:hypothetical protein